MSQGQKANGCGLERQYLGSLWSGTVRYIAVVMDRAIYTSDEIV